jgi:hypothetical protein
MHIEIAPRSGQIERPSYVWVAVILEILTGIFAVPVGWFFIQDPTGNPSGSLRAGSSQRCSRTI